KGRFFDRLREVNLRRLPFYATEVIRRMAPSIFRPVVGANVWGPRIPAIHGLMRDLDLVEVCCLQWRMCVELACYYGRHLPADRYFECRLEDLCEDILRQILRFCHLEEDRAVVDYFHREFDADAPR